MAKTNFQFHACRAETANFILDCSQKFNLTIVLIDLFPIFKYRVGTCKDFAVEDILNSREVMLMKKAPAIGVTHYLQFMQSNDDFMNILLGDENEQILSESVISAVGNKEALVLWKKIIGQLKKTMLRGAWVYSADGKSKNYYCNHRYTELAKRKYEQGCKICPVAGNTKYELKSESTKT